MELLPRKTNLRLLCRRPGLLLGHYWPGLLLLGVGATADLLTTFINLRRYGPAVEAHVVQRLVSEIVGVAMGVPLAKLIQLAFVLLVASWWRPWCPWVLSACGVLYGLAAVSNHLLLL